MSITMRRISTISLTLLLWACDTERAPDCLKTSGSTVKKMVAPLPFEEIIVFQGVEVFLEQGEDHQVIIETGKNFLEDTQVKVVDKRLIIRKTTPCNLFRSYNNTSILVRTPTLNWLQNNSGRPIRSVGQLRFPELWLRSFNDKEGSREMTTGDFILDLEVEKLRITNDNFSNYFLSGSAEKMELFFLSGDGRLEAGGLVVQEVDLLHRGTNSMIVNPQFALKGDIYSFGDVIALSRPEIVEVRQHYSGRLIFE